MTKQKPATPLPWRTLADQIIPDEADECIADCMGALEPRMKNSAYIAHACNAYPKLVEALSATFDCPCTLKERDSGHRVGCAVPERVALLHELGEVE